MFLMFVVRKITNNVSYSKIILCIYRILAGKIPLLKERNAMKIKNQEMALMCDFVSPTFHNYSDAIKKNYVIYSDLLI